MYASLFFIFTCMCACVCVYGNKTNREVQFEIHGIGSYFNYHSTAKNIVLQLLITNCAHEAYGVRCTETTVQ